MKSIITCVTVEETLISPQHLEPLVDRLSVKAVPMLCIMFRFEVVDHSDFEKVRKRLEVFMRLNFLDNRTLG